MVNAAMLELGSKRSVIRELFEFGKKRAAEVGSDRVYDFSLGNPNVEPPKALKRALKSLLRRPTGTSVHGYTSAQGDAGVRKAIADSLNRRFRVGITPDLLYLTCGAAAALTITLRALNEADDDFILLAPYFPEYSVFITAQGGKVRSVPFSPADFQPDLSALAAAITPKTKAVLVNSPNNPSGVVYSRSTLLQLVAVLEAKSDEYGHPIFIIADEPYRELVYGSVEVPYLMNLYPNTVVCTSFSKSLSLPGERIGYIAVCPQAQQADRLTAAIAGAGRALGYVCAPSLFQWAVARCVDTPPNLAAYQANRDRLYSALTQMGYRCIPPDGAFYLFVQALEADANAFAERAKTFGLLIVPGDDFGAPGFVRIAYCVSPDVIRRSLPAFLALADSYR